MLAFHGEHKASKKLHSTSFRIVKPSELSHLLSRAFRNNLKVLVVSPPGWGKSDIVTQAARTAEADLVIMHPAVSDPTDFKGMPCVVQSKEGNRAEFLPFGNLRRLAEAKALTVCFIDDIGQAPHAVQAALMQLIQAREIDGQKISDHVVFVGATNDASHMAGVTSILEPVKSRWHTILTLDLDLEEWVKWALGPGKMPAELVAFTRFRPALLTTKFAPTRELTNSPSPRTVAAIGQWLKTGINDYDVLAGAAGATYAAELVAFLKIFKAIPDLDAIIANPNGARLPDTADASLVLALCTALAYRATKDNFEAIITYLTRFPKEYEVMAVRDAITRDPALAGHKDFTAWSINNVEALA